MDSTNTHSTNEEQSVNVDNLVRDSTEIIIPEGLSHIPREETFIDIDQTSEVNHQFIAFRQSKFYVFYNL